MSAEIDWKAVPRQALVDALRNAMIGPTNLSRQDKPDLIALAKRALDTLDEPRRLALLEGIATETAHRRPKEAARVG